MECRTCGVGERVEIAAKTIRHAATRALKCHRLECGHAWHLEVPTSGMP